MPSSALLAKKFRRGPLSKASKTVPSPGVASIIADPTAARASSSSRSLFTTPPAVSTDTTSSSGEAARPDAAPKSTLPHPIDSSSPAIGEHPSTLPVDRRLEKLQETLGTLSRTLQAQGQALALLQRQYVVLETRLAAVEGGQQGLQTQVVESRRMAGDVALRQSSMESIVRQLEERWSAPHRDAPPPPSRELRAAGGSPGSPLPKEWRSEVRALVADALAQPFTALPITVSTASSPASGNEKHSAPTADAPPRRAAPATTATPGEARDSATAPSTEAVMAQLEVAKQRADAVQARLDHYILQQIIADGVIQEAAHGNGRQPPGDTVAGEEGGGQRLSSIDESIARLLKFSAVLPYRDSNGGVQLLSQVIRIGNVPPNVGAAEVRALCAACLGPEAIRSVVVAATTRTPSAYHTGSTKDSTSQKLHITSSSGNLHQDRCFDVTLASVQHAARAIAMLPRAAWGQVAHTTATTVSADAAWQAQDAPVVRPVVSVDLVAAWERLRAAAPSSKAA